MDTTLNVVFLRDEDMFVSASLAPLPCYLHYLALILGIKCFGWDEQTLTFGVNVWAGLKANLLKDRLG